MKRPSTSDRKKSDRTIGITFISKTGEETMSTVNPINGGFQITGANSIVANLLLSPANGPANFLAKFPRSAATGSNSMTGLLTRTMPDGTQQNLPVALSAPTQDPIPFPAGLFTGRSGTWSVNDQGPNRTLSISVSSTDGTGVNEPWSLTLTICVPAGGQTNFTVISTTTQATVSSVTVTPPS